MRHLHLFDFDGTLTRHDSFTGFIRHVHGMRGLIRVLLQSSWAIILWKTGFRSNTYAKLHMFAAAFKGMDAEEFRNAGKTYADKINRMVRPETKASLNAAVRQNEEVAIVSASLGDWTRPWAGRTHSPDNRSRDRRQRAAYRQILAAQLPVRRKGETDSGGVSGTEEQPVGIFCHRLWRQRRRQRNAGAGR